MPEGLSSHPPAARAPAARATVAALEYSKIREITNLGAGQSDIIRLWVGEPDHPTPDFIKAAAVRALADGQTFYGPNNGIPALREALAAYHTRLRRQAVDPTRICVTASGVNALMIAMQALLDPGDRLVTTTPCWPNGPVAAQVLGAVVDSVPLHLADGVWQLDMDRFCAAITQDTKAVLINSPANPTGWVADLPALRQLLDHCRARGVWIISDEVYDRLHYGPGPAPSILDVAAPDDRVMVVQSFSKTWAMTGWRLGWLVVPPGLEGQIAKLTEVNLSCAPGFIQHAGVAAVTEGEPFIAEVLARFAANRDRIIARFAALPGVSAVRPAGAFYAFVHVAGCDDSLALAKEILQRARVGVAPGSAFGAAGEGHLRLCFGSPAALLDEGLDRLAGFFHTR